MDFEEVPWLAVIGGASALGVVLYNLNAPNFLTALFPAYFIEIAMLITLGLELPMDPHALKDDYGRSRPFLAFLMVMVWLLSEVLLWTGGEGSLAVWIPALLQGFLAWHYFTSPKPVLSRARHFIYAGLYIVFMVAASKVLLNVINPVIPWNLMAWTLAVFLVCLGYILPFHDISEEWVSYLPPLGTVLGFASALGLGGLGLSLL